MGISRFEFNDDYRNAIKLIHPDDQQRVQEELKKLMSGQAVSDEFRIIQKDGAIKYIRSHAEPVFDKEGVAGFIGTMQDITEKKSCKGKQRLSSKKSIKCKDDLKHY